MSVAIVCMVNNTAIDYNLFLKESEANKSSLTEFNTYHHKIEECQADNSSKIERDGPFEWDKRVQGMILSAYFFGYSLTQVLYLNKKLNFFYIN